MSPCLPARRVSQVLVVLVMIAGTSPCAPLICSGQEPELPAAKIDGTGPGWKPLTEADFVPVNGDADTWTFGEDWIHTTGKPVGVTRTQKQYTNFELVVQWRHLESGGNSGVFLWVSDEGLAGLQPGQLPSSGIEVQMLDHGYHEKYQRATGKTGDWFTTNGDIFPVSKSTMKPFPPISPDGSRSFPSKDLSHGVQEWNHYYVRAINGEVRLWVNGEEVSGGSDSDPRSGYLCLEAEGSPVELKHLRIRELP